MTGNRIGVNTGDAATFESFEDLLQAYKKQVAHFVWLNAVNVNRHQKLRELWSPYPFLSCLISDCIENGKDITAGGARYNLTEPELAIIPIILSKLCATEQLRTSEPCQEQRRRWHMTLMQKILTSIRDVVE